MTIFYYDVYAGDGQIQVPSDAAAIVAKATEGTYYHDTEYSWFKQQAANRGLPFSGYHFLSGNNDPAAQAAFYFAMAGTTPCMVDVEPEDSANSKPTLDQTVAFIQALRGLGGVVWGVYFPQWYWGQVGGDLSRLTALSVALVSSNYTAYSDSGAGWGFYGGATPEVWQFTSTPLDKNAFKGTQAQLADLFNGVTPTTTEDDMAAFATGIVTPGLNQTTVILPPPANSGAAGWGNVWFSLGSDMGDAHVRVTLFANGAWTDFNENFVVPAAGPRVFPFPSPLLRDVEKISVTREAGSENVPLSYLIEVR